MADEEDVAKRADLLPEEEAAGSDVPRAQAEAILDESEARKADPEAEEQRTSDEVAIDPPG